MKSVGILSDTHGWIHPRVMEFFSGVDEIWHAGDMGDISVAESLRALKPFRGVYGNIDGADVRKEFPQYQLFEIGNIRVLMTHIGGYPGRYEFHAKERIMADKPKLFVCGHSHILKVIYDPQYELLHINPGAAGKYGIHRSVTAVRLIIDGTNLRDLEVLDIQR